MKYLWSTYVQLMCLEVLQLFTFFRLELWRGLTPPYEWMALRWLFVATSAPILDCAFVSIGEYVFKKPDVSCFKEIYTQLRYSNPKCREDESKAKVHGSKSLTSLTMEGWWVKGEPEGGKAKAKLSKLPSQASKRRNKATLATFWSCWAEDHQGIGIHLTTSHDPIIPMIPMILPLHESWCQTQFKITVLFWIVHCTSLCCSSQNCNMKHIEKLWVNLLPGHRNLTKQGPRLKSNTNAFNMQCMQSQQAVKVLMGCSWSALSLIQVVYGFVFSYARMVGERQSNGFKSWPFFGHLHLSRIWILIVAPVGAASIPCWQVQHLSDSPTSTHFLPILSNSPCF